MKLGSVIIFISVLVCIKASQKLCNKTPEEDKSLVELTTSIRRFSKSFIKCLRGSYRGNYVVSPLNLHNALGIIMIGARGSTLIELNKILGTNNLTYRVTDDYKKLMEKLWSISSSLQLSHKIWLPRNYYLKPSFVSLLRYSFKNAAIGLLNFSNTQSAKDVINSWSQSCFFGSSTNLTNLENISMNASLIMSSILSFKGIMPDSLEVKNIEIRKFFVNERVSREVPMMHLHGPVIYGFLPKIEVPFIKYEIMPKELSMIIIRSNGIQEFRRVDQQLDDINISDILNRGYLINMTFFFPKFRIENTIDLKEIVQKMGGLQIFNSSANFSGISDRRLYVDRIFQKVSVDINENLTTVFSSTDIRYPKRITRSTSEDFDVNSPFHFVIFHEQTKLPLIRGRVVVPMSR